MNYYLIANNAVVGYGHEGMGVPKGMQLIASPLQLPPNKLYYDGAEIRPIPDKPEGDYIWAGTEWQPAEPREIPKPKPVSSNQLAVAAYEHLRQIDEVLADALAYLFAKLEGDAQEIDLRRQRLSKHLIKTSRRKINNNNKNP